MTENRTHNASKDTHNIPSTLFVTKLILLFCDAFSVGRMPDLIDNTNGTYEVLER
jgi:hypothetical protein